MFDIVLRYYTAIVINYFFSLSFSLHVLILPIDVYVIISSTLRISTEKNFSLLLAKSAHKKLSLNDNNYEWHSETRKVDLMKGEGHF